MRWRKLGQLYCPKPICPKLISHAANPLAVFLERDIYRVFFSGRDVENRSSIGFVDVDIAKRQVVYIHDKSVFTHGPSNSFYSHGVSIGNCYEVDGRRYMLFMGWQCPSGEHWRGEIGRLVLEPDFSLRIGTAEPFMSTDTTDPISLSYPWVIPVHNGGYHMWYGSTIIWDAGNGEMLHVINHATSHDGHHWERRGLSIPYSLGTAQAFSRPSVIEHQNDGGGYDMWFSYRSGSGEKYRIGYATSANRETWELRLDETGIDVSTSGWDSEMIAYPFVFDHKGQQYLLYNGNGYGKTGFGLAVLETR
jgi:hypothetical protein